MHRVEQILPTLATKDDLATARRDLERAIEPLATSEELCRAIEPLATREEMHRAIADAIVPLATKEELRAAVAPLATKEEVRELRRHMDVLSESQRGDIQLLAEHLSVAMSKLADR